MPRFTCLQFIKNLPCVCTISIFDNKTSIFYIYGLEKVPKKVLNSYIDVVSVNGDTIQLTVNEN